MSFNVELKVAYQVFKRFVLCVAFLECPLRKSNVVFTRSVFVCCDLCVENDDGFEAIVVEWANHGDWSF